MTRLVNYRIRLRGLAQSVLEACVVYASLSIGLQIGLSATMPAAALAETVIFTLSMSLAMAMTGMYSGSVESIRAAAPRMLAAYGLALVIAAVAYRSLAEAHVGVGRLLVASLLGFIAVIVTRLLVSRLAGADTPMRRVLVLGNGREAEQAIRFLHRTKRSRAVQFAGLYPVAPDRISDDRSRQPDHDALLRAVKELNVTEIVVAVHERRGGVLPLRQLLDAKQRGIRVVDLPSFYERELGLLDIGTLRASWLIFGSGFEEGAKRDILKRTVDGLLSLVILTFALPLMALVATVIVATTGRPIFTRQACIGQGGRRFERIRFRTCVRDVETLESPPVDDTRTGQSTRVGEILRRLHIDCLPMLFNVALGNMSFVGPRAQTPIAVERHIDEIPYYDLRHSVKPGLTGWAQIRLSKRLQTEAARKQLQFDLFYVKNRSFGLDMLILFETLRDGLGGEGNR